MHLERCHRRRQWQFVRDGQSSAYRKRFQSSVAAAGGSVTCVILRFRTIAFTGTRCRISRNVRRFSGIQVAVVCCSNDARIALTADRSTSSATAIQPTRVCSVSTSSCRKVAHKTGLQDRWTVTDSLDRHAAGSLRKVIVVAMSGSGPMPQGIAFFRRHVVMLCLALSWLTGCAAFHPMNGVPARYLPDEMKVGQRNGKRTIDLSLLRQEWDGIHLVDSGDVLGIYIGGVLGKIDENPQVQIPQNSDYLPGRSPGLSPRGWHDLVADDWRFVRSRKVDTRDRRGHSAGLHESCFRQGISKTGSRADPGQFATTTPDADPGCPTRFAKRAACECGGRNAEHRYGQARNGESRQPSGISKRRLERPGTDRGTAGSGCTKRGLHHSTTSECHGSRSAVAESARPGRTDSAEQTRGQTCDPRPESWRMVHSG